MDEKKFNSLLSKLDLTIESLNSRPSSSHSTEQLCSVGVLSENTDIESMNEKQLLLSHTMLHMFYNSKNGKNMPVKTIEKLHSQISKRLKNHSKFDRLDL